MNQDETNVNKILLCKKN